MPNGEGKKPRKVPCNAQGVPANHLDPANHMTYADAVAGVQASGGMLRLGFAVIEGDPIMFLDIDSCRMDDGTWSVEAQNLMACVPGALQEVSVSGNGLHALWAWDGPVPEHSKKNPFMNAEFYSEGRFLAIGDMASAVGDSSTVIDPKELIDNWFPPKDTTLVEWRDGPVPEWKGHTDDGILITDACTPAPNDSSVFGGGEFASFSALWNRDVVVLSDKFPGDGEQGVDWSRVDHALAKQLSYQTGKDHARIERLMWQSKLPRDKWKTHPDYLKALTITDAVNRTKAVRGEKKTQEPLPPAQLDANGMTFGCLQGNQLAEYFRDMVYIQDADKILTINGLINQSRFKAMYGGQQFEVGDPTKSKVVRDAWDGIMNNMNFKPPKVHTSCFRPDIAYGDIIFEGTITAVNTCKLPVVPMHEGDTSMLMWLMQILLPEDWQPLFYYFCFVVQYPGIKAKWMPLLQGPQGCGKGILTGILAYAVGGHGAENVHKLEPGDIENNFNAYMAHSILIHIDEIKVGNKWELMEKMKSYITEDRIQITAKGVDQVTKRQCANFVASTNHRTGVPITMDDRRWGIFWTEPQDRDDMLACGLTDDFFIMMVDWLKEKGGYEACAHLLKNTAIPDAMNPAVGSIRAPMTSTRMEAVDENMGKIETLISEAISEARAGFMNGMTSSAAITKGLEAANSNFATNRFPEMMQGLGYVRLPVLRPNKYKVNNGFNGENGRPVLYAIKGHEVFNIQSGAEVRRYYMAAQGYDKLEGVPDGTL